MQSYEAGARKLAVQQSPIAQDRPEPSRLLPGGLSRFNDIKPYLSVSCETWRLMVKAGRAPRPTRINGRCTVWRNDDVLSWLADPVTFEVEG